jgi:hypothetical protein
MTVINPMRDIGQLLAKSSTFSTVEAERQSSSRMQLVPGQPVQAEVLVNLPNNHTLLRVAGELMKMELPVTVRPGDNLPMTFLTEEPRLTFILSRPADSGSPVHISDTGKLLGMLTRDADQTQVNALPATKVILESPPVDTATLAARLRETLTLSGIFYESHLVQWSKGERSLKEILREPQGKSATRAKFPLRQASRTLIDVLLGTEEKTPDETVATEHGDVTNLPVEPEMMPILKQQMQTLHSGQFVWRGEVWPGQDMEWAVGEREAESGEKQERELETTLRLAMSNLGEVSATLRLSGDGVKLHLVTNRDSAATAMHSDRQGLEDAMSAAGIRLMEMVVDHGQDGSAD